MLLFRCAVLCILCLCGLTSRAAADGGAKPGLLVVSGGMAGLFDNETNPAFSLEYRFARSWHKVSPWVGGGWATDGAVFVGGGAVYTHEFASGRWALAAGCGPGYYERHEGEDLGGHLEFYSFAEVSRGLRRGHRISLRIVHVSNGGLEERNPGAELLMLGYAIPLP